MTPPSKNKTCKQSPNRILLRCFSYLRPHWKLSVGAYVMMYTQDLEQAGEMPPVIGRVKMENVNFRYRAELPEVLHAVSLTIEAGQTVALVGLTGAGKTSIGNLIARFYDVTGGRVMIDDIDVRQVKQASLHRQIGLVPQDSFLFSGSIADNIRFGCPEASDDCVE